MFEVGVLLEVLPLILSFGEIDSLVLDPLYEEPVGKVENNLEAVEVQVDLNIPVRKVDTPDPVPVQFVVVVLLPE